MTTGGLDMYAAAVDAATDPRSADRWYTRTHDGRTTSRVRLERDGQHGDWFDWALVGADAADGTAAAGLDLAELWQEGDRWFAALVRLAAATDDLDVDLDLAS